MLVSGVPPVLSSPYISDIENHYHLGQYYIQVQYNNPDPVPARFIFEIALSRQGEELFRVTSHPVVYTPGNYFYRTFDDSPLVRFSENPLDIITGGLRDQVLRGGIIPEGDYLLEVEVVCSDPFATVTSIPSYTPFEVRFPQPPVLMAPFDGGSVPPVFPVFSWTPVIGMPMFQFEYEVLIAEILEGQTPLQAIQANRVHARSSTRQPLLIYTADNLPLEAGKQYAWQVQASEVNGLIPVSDYGRTEIYTFSVGNFAGDFDTDQLQRIGLVPDLAELVNLDNMDITTGTHSVIMDGSATLRLDLRGIGEGFVEAEVNCHDLEVQMGDLSNPVVMGGYVTGDLSGVLLPLEGAGDIISIDKIEWTLADGLTVDAGFIDPSGNIVEASGRLNLTTTGIHGTITATGPAGDPLFNYGVHPVELAVNSVTLTFPGAFITTDARLKFFSEPTPCNIPDMMISGGGGEFSFACPIEYDIPLMPGSDMATLYLKTAGGNISVHRETSSLDYSLNVSSSIRLKAPDDNHYEIPVALGLSSVTGVSAGISVPSLTYNSPDIDLGIAGLRIARFNDPWLTYDPAANSWDFGLGFDASLSFPSFDDLRLPELYGISLDKDGIHFPSVHFDEDDLFVVPQLNLAGFGATLTSFTIPEFTFPWFTRDELFPGPWDFDFDFRLTFPEFPGHMPSCLRNLSLDIEEAGFSDGRFSAVIPSTVFGENECGFDIGAGYGLSVNQLGGELAGVAEAGEFSIDGHLSLDAALRPGSPFDCAEDSELQLGAENFFMSSTGMISGEVSGIIPACPVGIGPYKATVTESLLTFSAGNAGQSAVFEASAYLEFPVQSGATNTFGGELGIDLITGEFTTLSFEIDEPFVWNVPSEENILSFNLQSAEISLGGLMVDGSQEFRAGDRNIGVAFNEVLLDLKSFRIKNGNILFDEAFAFEAGIDPGDFSLLYRAVAPEDELSLDPGILFGLAGVVQIDSRGLRADGSAGAELSFGGIEIGGLSVDFSSDFAFGLDPFGVESGQADVYYEDNLVAVISETGFDPILSALINLDDVIPQHLPLPHSDIAYLELKDDEGNMLVDFVHDEENNLEVIIGTRPGQPVNLILPVLQGDLSAAPLVGVEFSNVRISLSPLKFESGEIHVDVSGMSEFADLQERFGIPLSLENIAYGNFDDLHDFFKEGLFFTGQLTLFDEQLGENSTVSMFVQQDGTIVTSFNLSDMNSNIPLVPESDIAVINVNALSGYVEYPLLNPLATPEYEFMIDGGFVLQYDPGNKVRADILARYDRQGLQLTDFEYDIGLNPPQIDLDPFIFRIDEIQNLHMDYQRESGFDFFAGLDLSIGMKMEDDNELVIPLKGVEIRPSGFVIPAQEINDGSDPMLTVPPVSISGINLQPLAFRMDGAVVDIYDFSPGDLGGLIPRVDFAVTFPGLASSFPSLSGVSLTVNDAGYSGGNFTGSIEAYAPLEPVSIPMGPASLQINQFSGNLQEIIDGEETTQGLDIFIEGSVSRSGIFGTEDPVESCDPVGFSLSIVEGRGFAGTITNFVPCGNMPVGGLSLSFDNDSRLEFGYEDGIQKAVIAGGAELLIPRAGDVPGTATARGTLGLDLITGTLIDGSIEINDAFHWSLPAEAEEPFFTFVVNSALLDSAGLTLRAQGDMQVTENVLVDVQFDNLVIGLDDFRIKDGQASISTGFADGGELVSSGFAFELLFLPVDWRMVPVNQQVPADTSAIRLNLDGIGVTLDKDGIALSGESTASIHLADALTGEDESAEPEETDNTEPDDIETEFAGLRLALVDNFRFDYRTYSVESGAAQIWKTNEGAEPDLLAWYDADGLGLGNILGILPIPDTLGLPDNDIAYLVLKETDPASPDYGNLLVEMESGEEGRTLRTRPGKSVKLVLESLGGEDDDAPVFLTDFSITINSAYEITGGSIEVDFEGTPFKVPDLPVSLTSLAYERRDNGVAALTAAAVLELPASLNGLEVNMDELRFSTEGFEQVTFSVGSTVSNLDTLSAHAFPDSVLAFNLFHATASFGDQNGFGFRGTITSSFFKDRETGLNTSIPFRSHYGQSSEGTNQWQFGFDLEELQLDSIAISHARLWLTEIDAVATSNEFTLTTSGTISVPELLGDDFAITLSQLSLGTNGIQVGGVEVHAEPQQFSLLGGRVTAAVNEVRPEYDQENKVLKIGLDGWLSVLERTADFRDMKIGTDGSFSVEGGIDANLLTGDVDIIEDHLALTGLFFGISGESRLRLTVAGTATMPEPFSASSPFSVSIEQTGRKTAEITDVSGPSFRFVEEDTGAGEIEADGDGEGGDGEDDGQAPGEMPGVYFGDIAGFFITGADLDIDFDDVQNTTFYATANLEIYSDGDSTAAEPKIIMFGEAASIREKYGMRYNYNDGLSWNITSTPSPGNRLFEFSSGFFSIEVETVAPSPTEGDFFVDIGGRAGLNLPGLSGWAEFEGFRIAPDGIREYGSFRGDGGLEATLMNVVNLSLGDFEYEKKDTIITIITDNVVDADVENDEGPDTGNYSTETIEVLEYLLVENAGISLIGEEPENATGTDNKAAVDIWGGGVERILFYRTSEGISLNIEHAAIEIPAASIDVSMNYQTIGGYSLSVAGTGKLGFDDTGVEIGVAGKIASINNELSLGLFVKASVEPGIPVIPAIITLKGLGGGFYYNPSPDDFSDVRQQAGLQYLNKPEFNNGTRFAAFLYAGVGLIGEQEYSIDGDFFMEITGSSTSLHVDAELFAQGEKLKSLMFLNVGYGDNPIVQGLCRLDVGYAPALHGGGEIGFFAKPGPVWAIAGETSVDFFILNTSSDFIVCNDGMLANLKIDAEYESSIISLSGSLDASVWYYQQTGDIGAFGEINAMVSIAGATASGKLFGAFITRDGERLLYAQGEVDIDVILWEGTSSAWASYSSAGWEAGRGNNPEFEQMITDSRRQADDLRDAAGSAADNVAAAVAAIEGAEGLQDLMAEIDNTYQGYARVYDAKGRMDRRIAHLSSVSGEIIDRLGEITDHTIGLRDQTVSVARQLENPVTYGEGSVDGADSTLTVSENPSININSDIAGQNETDLNGYRENVELQLQFYHESIEKTLYELSQLEMMMDGESEISSQFAAVYNKLPGGTVNPEPLYGSPARDQFQLTGDATGSQPATLSTSQEIYTQTASPVTQGHARSFSLTRNFNYLAEQFTGSIESIKEFYHQYAYVLWTMYVLYDLIEDKEAPAYPGEIYGAGEEPVLVKDVLEAHKNLIINADNDYNSLLPSIEEMHAVFTASLDNLYMLKAEITATLYGMIEEYSVMSNDLQESQAQDAMMASTTGIVNRATGETGSGSSEVTGKEPVGQSANEASAELDALRSSIAELLEPPVISSFIVNSSYGIYASTGNINWQADHPDRVAETSYFISPVTASGTGRYASAGLLNSLKHYSRVESHTVFDENTEVKSTNSYNISLRARGSGGNTTIRSSRMDMRVAAGGETSASGEQVSADVPPPATPTVELPACTLVLSPASPVFEPVMAAPTGLTGSVSTGGPGFMQKNYFTNDPNRIILAITAHDEQTDIVEFEYAVGSGSGQSDIVEWTKAVGVIEHVGSGGSGVTRRMETTVRGLNLEHAGRYYISARAKNSAGKSAEFYMSDPVIYDATPPPAPEGIFVIQGTVMSGIITSGVSTPVVYPVVSRIPQFKAGKVNFPSYYAGEPTITKGWNSADDPESGITGYEYILTHSDNPSEAFGQENIGFTSEPRVTITGDQVTYTDSLYLHVRSRNNAGSVSQDVLTYGPLMPHDPSAPTAPMVNVVVAGNGVKLCFPYLSGDYESQVKGYKYSIGTAPGATNIRGWSSSIDIGHHWETVNDPRGIDPDPPGVPVHFIPAGELPAEATGDIYVNVMAANGQNMYSPVVCSGPFMFNTRPEEPSISLSYNSFSGELTLNIQNVFDEGAPVASVSYRIADMSNGNLLKNWTVVPNFSGGKLSSPGSVTTSTFVGTGTGKGNLIVEVRVTNSMGRSSTGTMQSGPQGNQIPASAVTVKKK